MMNLSIIALVSYLLGSIPFGYLLVRIFHGRDVRETGSGNIGATNVSRTSPILGISTLFLDALKGAAAVSIAFAFSRRGTLALPISEGYLPGVLAALFVVVGHMFPVWLKFRGGKGVATGLGSFIVLAPKAVLFAIGVFVAVVLLFRYVSLASIFAVASFPLLVWALHENSSAPACLTFIIAISLLIIFKHHENIRRLASGNENRFSMRRG